MLITDPHNPVAHPNTNQDTRSNPARVGVQIGVSTYIPSGSPQSEDADRAGVRSGTRVQHMDWCTQPKRPGRGLGTGHLYDWDALRKIESENGKFEVPTGRLPVVLYGYKILAGVSYPVARSICMAVGIAALILFAAFWPGAVRPVILLALAWPTPLTLVLLFGQDLPFWMMFFATAGVVFSLCICKFHLALGIPVMLAAQKRWKTLFAGLAGFLVLIAACFLIEGPE